MAPVSTVSKRKSEDGPVSIPKKSKKPKLDETAKLKKATGTKKSEAFEALKSVLKSSAPNVQDKLPQKRKTSRAVKSGKLQPTEAAPEESEDEEAPVADQSAALLAGFESSSESGEDEQERGLALDKIPEAPIMKSQRKELDAAAKKKKKNEDEPGTVYVGHIPHGFYEPQMRAYFSQFGNVTRLRLARNKRTGASKHYAFVEFDSTVVADIVARTMNKYLMFGHILEVNIVPKEKLHPELWKGANKRYHIVPRKEIQGRWLSEPKSKEIWEKRIEKERAKREAKAEKMKELGYEFEMPKVKGVDEAVHKNGIENGEESRSIEAVPEVVESETVVEKTLTSVTVTETVTVEKLKKSKERRKAEEGIPETAAGTTKKLNVKKSKSKSKKA